MDSKQQLENLLEAINQRVNAFIYAVLSSPIEKSATPEKITIRFVKNYFQITHNQDDKAIHRNIRHEQLASELRSLIPQYKQIMLYTAEGDYHLLFSKKGKMTLIRKEPTRRPQPTAHNRRKNTPFQEGEPQPFLVELGVMNPKGKVYAKKQHKFHQVNKFLEIVSDVVQHFPKAGPIHVVDFGCGKATLTFGLYAFLNALFGERVFVHGVDQKQDVVENCLKIARQLDHPRLTFSQGSVDSYQSEVDVTMVVALHACDTATDDALAKAVEWNADVILAAPCCQHELALQIENDALRPLLKHGILKERFAALVTDAARALILEESGYRTQVLEFIDFEHTAKNLLIRAVKSEQAISHSDQSFEKLLNIKPKLAKLLKR